MKKVLIVFGGVAVAIVVVLIIAAAIFIPRTLKLDREATSYIQDAVPRIVANWNSQELVNRATPQLLEAGKSRENIDHLFAMFSKLGALKHLNTPEGGIFSSAYSGRGVATVGNYKAVAEFEKGEAEIQIQLLRSGDDWKINGFHINSTAFMASTPSPPPSSTP